MTESKTTEDNRLKIAVWALKDVLNSDMAQREEDEGKTSMTLQNVRLALKEIGEP